VRSISLLFVGACFAFPLLAGCSGAGGDMSIPGGGSSGSGGSGGKPSGAQVFVRIVADQTPVPDTDGAERETPIDQRLGILGLQLLRSESDPSPLVVFQNQTPVDTGYNAGNDTLVGTATASALTAGTYLFARVPVAYTKFTVAGTYHEGSLAVPGQFADTISLSAQTLIDGAQRNQGWFSDSFVVGSTTEGTVTGEGAQIAQPATGSGVVLDMSNAAGAYLFPVNLVIDPAVGHDVTITFTFNTYEDFHWVDQSQPGYEAGTFDVSYGAWEPITQLGANSFTVTME
jgi:hypothetical protein